MAARLHGLELTNSEPSSNEAQLSPLSRGVSFNFDAAAYNLTQDDKGSAISVPISRPDSPVSPLTHPRAGGQRNHVDWPRQSADSLKERKPEVPEKPPQLTKDKSFPIFQREMHWVSKKVMVGCVMIAIALMLGHHFWYRSLASQPIGASLEQQRTRLLGNFFPVAISTLLGVSMEIAFTQYLFLCLQSRPVTVKCLDTAYAATSSLLFLFNKEMLKVLPDVALLAFVIGTLTIMTTMLAPPSLVVSQAQATQPVQAYISQLAISNPDPNQAGYFYLSRPAFGENSTDNTTVIFLGPRTNVPRLSEATGATGQILPINPPAANSSYYVQFYGPYVQCKEPNQTVADMIDLATYQSMGNNDTALEVYNAYHGFVPDLSSPERWGTPNSRTTDPSRSSNQLWLSFKQNGTGWDETLYPKCPLTAHRVCQLYNAHYNLSITFENGIMSVSFPPPTDLAEVEYPAMFVNSSIPSERLKMSYSSYMWSLTELITGTMGLYVENITQAGVTYNTNFTKIDSNIDSTALLGSTNLACFFGIDWMYHNAEWLPSSPQRALDIDFARNETLDVLIPELSANLTISLMTNPLLAPSVMASVNVTTHIAVYEYRPLTLLVSYGVAILAVLVANILGLIAFLRNEVITNRCFSSTASATQHTNLIDEEHYPRRGSTIPRPVGAKKVLFRKLDGGGWGFYVLNEIQE